MGAAVSLTALTHPLQAGEGNGHQPGPAITVRADRLPPGITAAADGVWRPDRALHMSLGLRSRPVSATVRTRSPPRWMLVPVTEGGIIARGRARRVPLFPSPTRVTDASCVRNM